jgi:hypothetical protein
MGVLTLGDHHNGLIDCDADFAELLDDIAKNKRTA